jgi:hypothetical protein
VKNKILLVGLLSTTSVKAQNYSHDHINNTRSTSNWFTEQTYLRGESANFNSETFQFHFGYEYFGFWSTSLTSNILHKDMNDKNKYFMVGHGVGVETQAIFQSPVVNIGILTGLTGNSYRIPEKDNRKLASTYTYTGFFLERFWSYKASYGLMVKSGIEKFDNNAIYSQTISEGGMFLTLWNK